MSKAIWRLFVDNNPEIFFAPVAKRSRWINDCTDRAMRLKSVGSNGFYWGTEDLQNSFLVCVTLQDKYLKFLRRLSMALLFFTTFFFFFFSYNHTMLTQILRLPNERIRNESSKYFYLLILTTMLLLPISP